MTYTNVLSGKCEAKGTTLFRSSSGDRGRTGLFLSRFETKPPPLYTDVQQEEEEKKDERTRRRDIGACARASPFSEFTTPIRENKSKTDWIKWTRSMFDSQKRHYATCAPFDRIFPRSPPYISNNYSHTPQLTFSSNKHIAYSLLRARRHSFSNKHGSISTVLISENSLTLRIFLNVSEILQFSFFFFFFVVVENLLLSVIVFTAKFRRAISLINLFSSKNCNIFSVWSIFKCNPSKKRIINLLLLNNFYPYHIVPTSSKRERRIIVYGFGHSLWSAISCQRKWC